MKKCLLLFMLKKIRKKCLIVKKQRENRKIYSKRVVVGGEWHWYYASLCLTTPLSH